MPDTSTKVRVNCDICCEQMSKQPDGFACWPCKNYIPDDQLYRYAEHVMVTSDFGSGDECGLHQETGFINDDGVCMDCEEADSANQN